MSAAGLNKWSGIDHSQNGRDASQDYFQDYGPGRATEIKGKIKEVAGKVLGDAKLESEGEADQAAGKI